MYFRLGVFFSTSEKMTLDKRLREAHQTVASREPQMSTVRLNQHDSNKRYDSQHQCKITKRQQHQQSDQNVTASQ